MSVYCSARAACLGVHVEERGGGGGLFYFSGRVGSGRLKEGLVLDPTDGLHLVGVRLGAELVVLSVLALVSVSLQDVLVATVTRELVGHPAAHREREVRSQRAICLMNDS